jgi:hypothetical protein
MLKLDRSEVVAMSLTLGLLGCVSPAAAAVRIEGQVQAGGGPVARTPSAWATEGPLSA